MDNWRKKKQTDQTFVCHIYEKRHWCNFLVWFIFCNVLDDENMIYVFTYLLLGSRHQLNMGVNTYCTKYDEPNVPDLWEEDVLTVIPQVIIHHWRQTSHTTSVFLVFVNEFPFGIKLTVASIYSSLFSFSMFLVACAHTIDLNINCHSIALKLNSRTVAWRRTAHANVCDLLLFFFFFIPKRPFCFHLWKMCYVASVYSSAIHVHRYIHIA